MIQALRTAPGDALVFCHVVLWHARLARTTTEGAGLQSFVQPRRALLGLRLPAEEVMRAVSSAYALLPKQDRCLVVAVVAASALRAFARDVSLCDVVIGVVPRPFASHAWFSSLD